MSQFRFKINNLVSKDFFYKNPPWMASYAYLNFESKIWHFLLLLGLLLMKLVRVIWNQQAVLTYLRLIRQSMKH